MKKICLFFFTIAIIFNCSDIPNKSISKKLSAKELSKAIESDYRFSEIYELLRHEDDELSDMKKEFTDITYRRLFNYTSFLQDSTYWEPLYKEWEMEWEDEFGIYRDKVDSVINYWKNIYEENSLDKYAKIELVSMENINYHNSETLSDVKLGFKITLLDGVIDEITFEYGYKRKIHDGSFTDYYVKSICTTGWYFSSPIMMYENINLMDIYAFAEESIESLFRNYNLYIEIKSVSKGDIKLSIDDLNIPATVSDYLIRERNGEENKDYYKSDIIREEMYREYVSKEFYCALKSDKLKREKDNYCYLFYDLLLMKNGEVESKAGLIYN